MALLRLSLYNAWATCKFKNYPFSQTFSFSNFKYNCSTVAKKQQLHFHVIGYCLLWKFNEINLKHALVHLFTNAQHGRVENINTVNNKWYGEIHMLHVSLSKKTRRYKWKLYNEKTEHRSEILRWKELECRSAKSSREQLS